MNSRTLSTVYVVDPDANFCRGLQRSLARTGYRIVVYPDAESFLLDCNALTSGCLLTEIKLPGIDGLELQVQLKRSEVNCPVVFLTARGDVATAVQAMRNGAIDFIEKPISPKKLLAIIETALGLEAARAQEHARKLMVAAALANLTSREREIMGFVVTGKMNKTIANELCISIKTVEAHRARVMQKMGVDSVAALVQLAFENQRTLRAH